MRRTSIYLLATLLAASAMLSGCGGNNKAAVTTQAEISVRETVEFADPLGATEAILATLENRDVQYLDNTGLQAIFGISVEDVEDFVAVYSDANSGLCDMVFLDPVDEEREALRQALFTYQDKRIAEFANYDILRSQEISENAVVLDQGDYLILLMLPDNDAAQEIIDSYIPQ